MKKFFLRFFLAVSVTGLFLGAGLILVLPGFLKNQIEEKGSEALNSRLTINNLQIRWLQPGVVLENVVLSSDSFEGRFESVEIFADWRQIRKDPQPKVFAILGPTELDLKKGQTPSSGSEAQPSEARAARPLNLPSFEAAVHLKQFKIQTASGSVQLNKFDLGLRSPENLAKAVGDFSIETKSPLAMVLPGRMEGYLTLGPTFQSVSVNVLMVDLAGMAFNAQGKSQFNPPLHEWTIGADVEDIAKLPPPPSELPIRLESGRLRGSLNLRGTSVEQLRYSGDLEAQNIGGTARVQTADLTVKGPFRFNGKIKVTQTAELRLEDSKLDVDLSGAQVQVRDWIAKPPETSMTLGFAGHGSRNRMFLQAVNFRLGPLQGSVKGDLHLTPQKKSHLSVEMARTPLTGLEKLFPPLAKSPLTGALELKGDLVGDVYEPSQLTLSLDPLSLENVSGHISYQDPKGELRFEGPSFINARVQLDYGGGEITTANIDGRVDLTPLLIDVPGSFSKKSGHPLRARARISQARNSIEIETLSLESLAGDAQVSGRIRNPKTPELDISISTPNINLQRAREWLPHLSKFPLDGTLGGQARIQGRWIAQQGLLKSPLRFDGSLNLNLKEYRFPKPPPAPAGAASAEPKAEDDTTEYNSLLSAPVLRQANVKLAFAVNRIFYGDVLIQWLKGSANLKNSQLAVTGAIQQLLGGSMPAFQLQMPLVKLPTSYAAQTQFKGLRIEQFLAEFLPEWKGVATGVTDGTLQATGRYPSPKTLLSTAAQGNMRITNGFLSTVLFDQMANEKLAQIPQLGATKLQVATREARGNVQAQFRYAQGKLQIENLQIATPIGDELITKGWMDLEKNMDLMGTAYLSAPQVGGSVRQANSDSKGRFVLPIQLKGNALKPDLAIAADTVKTLLEKTARHEAQKAGQNLQRKAEDEVKKQLGNQIQKLLGR